MNKITIVGLYDSYMDGSNFYSYHEFNVSDIYDFEYIEKMIMECTGVPKEYLKRHGEYFSNFNYISVNYIITMV